MNTANLSQLLKENIVEVTFQKANGEVRKMKATTNESFIIPTNGTGGTSNPDVQTVVDVDLNEWRRFRLDSVIDVKVIERV